MPSNSGRVAQESAASSRSSHFSFPGGTAADDLYTIYRQRFLSFDLRRLMVGLGLFILLHFVFFFNDLQLVSDSTTLKTLILFRLLHALVCSVVVWWIWLHPGVSNLDRGAGVAGAAGAMAILVIVALRPADFTGYLVTNLVGIVLLFLILPEPPWVRLVPTGLMAAGTLGIQFVVHGHITGAFLASLVVAYVMVFFGGWVVSGVIYRQRFQTWGYGQQLQHLLVQRNEELRLRQHFISMVSHELRTPLGVILSSMELLDQHGGRLDAGQRQGLFSRSYAAIARMRQMIDRVHTLNRLENAVAAVEWHEVEVASWLDGVARSWQSEVAREHLLHYQLHGMKSGQRLRFAEELMRLVLDSLVDNACKYSPKGSWVRVFLIAQGKRLCFLVLDQGPGFAAEESETVFQPFVRGSAAANQPAIAGTGMGLAIVREALRQAGGEVGIGPVLKGSFTPWAERENPPPGGAVHGWVPCEEVV